MAYGRFPRRILLGTGTAAIGAGLFGTEAKGAVADVLATATPQLQTGVSALAQSAIGQLSTTSALLSKLQLSPALSAILTDVPSAVLVGGGLKHGAKVRRLRNPATLKIAANPNYVPQGQAFDASQQRNYAPRPTSGGGL